MNSTISEIHKNILKVFRDQRKKDSDFKFTLRKSDVNKRLSSGYWFHGNENYVAISFWSGTDWVRKVPNISLIIEIGTGAMRLELSAKDSPEKKELLFNTVASFYNIEYNDEYLLVLNLPYNYKVNFKQALLSFINNEKQDIDGIIEANKKIFQTKQNNKNRIGFISDEEFRKNLLLIRKYEQRKSRNAIPYTLNSIEIFRFGIISDVCVDKLPNDAQWIFVTGDNNSGKTSFLKALSIAICNGGIQNLHRYRIPSSYNINVRLNRNGKVTKHYNVSDNKIKEELNIISNGFVAYGPNRINIKDVFWTTNKHGARDFKTLLNRPYNSLFNTASTLFDIGFVYARNNEFPDEVKIYEDKYSHITEVITELCDSIVDIHFGRTLEYYLEDHEKLGISKGLKFEQLSSGYRNLIAMTSDMLIHLYFQQPNITDPSELEGIVIIDEIDLHFHPKMQRDIIIKLGELFPRIQFIVSTHSPIPLLGAPKGSVFLRIKSDLKNGISVTRLNKLEEDIKNLLPNSIYTSDIFDLDTIESVQNDDDNSIFLEDRFSDIEENKKTDEQLKRFEDSNEKFPSNLFK